MRTGADSLLTSTKFYGLHTKKYRIPIDVTQNGNSPDPGSTTEAGFLEGIKGVQEFKRTEKIAVHLIGAAYLKATASAADPDL